jgi:hypothetical protein
MLAVVLAVDILQVFEKLHLTTPDVNDGEILVTPNTQFEVQTNR